MIFVASWCLQDSRLLLLTRINQKQYMQDIDYIGATGHVSQLRQTSILIIPYLCYCTIPETIA